MTDRRNPVIPQDEPELSRISTGNLPEDEQIQSLLDAAHVLYKSNDDGNNAQHYPALARVPRDLFGICLVSVTGGVYTVGDVAHPLTIMSIAKPFVFALICQALGKSKTRQLIGVNSTGRAFNSLAAVEEDSDHLTNPMVNSGALATTSLVPGANIDAKWEFIVEGLSRFAGRQLSLNDEVYQSASKSNFRNHSIARLLQDCKVLHADPLETVELYTRQSCLEVTVTDLAVMSATLADGGTNPVTHDWVIASIYCTAVLSVMATAGLYETSGDWLYDVGLPGKSGVSGGIITCAPGKGGLGTFAPPLDSAGNSIKGQLVSRYLSHRMGLNMFASKPA
jgi:glutaminase